MGKHRHEHGAQRVRECLGRLRSRRDRSRPPGRRPKLPRACASLNMVEAHGRGRRYFDDMGAINETAGRCHQPGPAGVRAQARRRFEDARRCTKGQKAFRAAHTEAVGHDPRQRRAGPQFVGRESGGSDPCDAARLSLRGDQPVAWHQVFDGNRTCFRLQHRSSRKGTEGRVEDRQGGHLELMRLMLPSGLRLEISAMRIVKAGVLATSLAFGRLKLARRAVAS